MTTQKQKPAHEIRVGTIKASIWANHSPKTGTWHCVTFQRIYRVGDTWKRTSGFGFKDLPEVSRLAEQASRWIEQASRKPVQLDLPAINRPAA